ncbi:HU family DNA-binding protein [Streptomyces sp. MMCC 100]|uniref:HU family DNA-binding protein n=1 Tax=Streptomyces sp. MMCC 100 TaxID=3163555 RepID=UPI0035983DCD
MDKKQLVETTTNAAANGDEGGQLTSADVERVLDSLFGTVEHPGSIAEALNRRETVLLGSFGSFRMDGETATFRPGTALTEFLQDRAG